MYDFRVNKFYSFQYFKLINDINDNDFLMFTSLFKRIPLNIVQALEVSFLTATRRNTIMTDISSAKQACKLCYSLQLKSNIKSAIPSQAKWSCMFGHELLRTIIYTLLYQVFLYSSLRSFQYSYLMLVTIEV